MPEGPPRPEDGPGDSGADDVVGAPSRSLLAVASGLSHRLPTSRWKQRGGRVLAATVARLGGSAVVPVTLRDGSTVILDGRGRTEAGPFWTGTYEADTVDFLRRCTTTYGGHVVDVGANVGLITVPLARAGAIVTAIEPVPENAARIRRSALLSGVADRVRVVEVALGESAGSVTMVRDDGMGATTGNALDASIAPGAGGRRSVVARARLDDLDLGRVDVMKLDVEGSELLVLRGATALLTDQRPVIVAECNATLMPRYGHSFLDVAALLTPLGYRYFSFVSGTELAEQDPREGLGDVVAVPDDKVARLPAHVREGGPWTG